ncbi:hypothetical protein [Leisingera sp. JC1]|uniref:hypothetical protein n=1 Tax=Leisingera sp. JC1 TaxID=1855282 RepID=UPI000802F6B8|nr:hypothetical protein [Leisingera sp. JC1]OBY25393.1 hypothetical protein A9D60_06335 [Leisingera sp. JC1]
MSGRWIKRGLLALAAIPLVAIAAEVTAGFALSYPPALTFYLHELPFRGQDFDPEKWASAGECGDGPEWRCVDLALSCPRGPMVGDLLRNHLYTGRTERSEATGLLGEADGRTTIHGNSCDRYNLGWCSGFKMDPASLFVCYAEDGRVTQSGHIQH